MLRWMSLAVPLALAAAPVSVREAPPMFGPGTEGGALGLGIDYRVTGKLGLRADAAFFDNVDDRTDAGAASGDLSDENYLQRRSGGAMVDFYPAGEGFRLSGGVRVSPDRAGDETVRIGKLRSAYRVREWAPSFTVGYASERNGRLAFGVEAGAVFHGAPRISRLQTAGSRPSEPSFADEAEAERMTIENDIDDYKLYPTVQLSIGYRF